MLSRNNQSDMLPLSFQFQMNLSSTFLHLSLAASMFQLLNYIIKDLQHTLKHHPQKISYLCKLTNNLTITISAPYCTSWSHNSATSSSILAHGSRKNWLCYFRRGGISEWWQLNFSLVWFGRTSLVLHMFLQNPEFFL